MEPLSKYAMLDKLDSYYEKPDFSYQHILRFMDLLKSITMIISHGSTNRANTIVKRDSSVLYYDCTNFYFECEQADDEIVDEVTERSQPDCANTVSAKKIDPTL